MCAEEEEWMDSSPTKTLHLSHVIFSYLRFGLQMYMTRFGQMDTVLEKLKGGWWGNEEKRKLKRFFFWVQSSAITNLWEKKSCRKERGESFRRALFKTCAHEIMQTCKYFVQTPISKMPHILNCPQAISLRVHLFQNALPSKLVVWGAAFSSIVKIVQSTESFSFSLDTVQEHNSDMIIHD